jgi:hypothetical protein
MPENDDGALVFQHRFMLMIFTVHGRWRRFIAINIFFSEIGLVFIAGLVVITLI